MRQGRQLRVLNRLNADVCQSCVSCVLGDLEILQVSISINYKHNTSSADIDQVPLLLGKGVPSRTNRVQKKLRITGKRSAKRIDRRDAVVRNPTGNPRPLFLSPVRGSRLLRRGR